MVATDADAYKREEWPLSAKVALVHAAAKTLKNADAASQICADASRNADDDVTRAAALDAAIETDSDPFGACCWPSAVVAARALAARDVAGLRVLEQWKHPEAASKRKFSRTTSARVTFQDAGADDDAPRARRG